MTTSSSRRRSCSAPCTQRRKSRYRSFMGLRVGVVGATGATGQMTLALLRERSFPVDELRLFASKRSAGRRISWGDSDVTIEALDDGRFDGLDLVLNATSAALAREWVPRMVEAG